MTNPDEEGAAPPPLVLGSPGEPIECPKWMNRKKAVEWIESFEEEGK